MRTVKAKELKTGDEMVISGGTFKVGEIKKDDNIVAITTEGGLLITRKLEAPVNIKEKPDPKPYKTIDIKAQDVKLGDRVKDGIIGEEKWHTITEIRMTATRLFFITAKSETIHAEYDETFIKEITPAEEAAKDEYLEDRAKKEETLRLEMLGRKDDLEEKIQRLEMSIHDAAVNANCDIGKHINTLNEMQEGMKLPREVETEFYTDLAEDLEEALTEAREMKKLMAEIKKEECALDRVEDFLS